TEGEAVGPAQAARSVARRPRRLAWPRIRVPAPSIAGGGRRPRNALAEASREPGLHLLGVIAEGTGLPLVCDGAGLVHDVEALRPAGVDLVGGVSHRVHRERDAVAKAPDEVVRDLEPLLERARLRVAHVLALVRRHLPFV